MLMTSSSGCGLKTRHGLGPSGPAGGVRADRGHHLVEDAPAQLVGRAVLAQQFVQLVLAEVVVGQLQQALADLQAQPDDRPADQVRRPVDRADDPRHADRRQLAGGRLIEDERRVGVLLQEAGGDRLGHVLLDGLAHDRGLVLAEGHDDDLAGASRMVPTPMVMAWCGTFSSPKKSPAASRRVTGSSVTRRVRLWRVEPGSLKPMWPVRPMPRILQVDAAGPADLLLVAGAVFLDVVRRRHAVGDVDVLRLDVDVVEEASRASSGDSCAGRPAASGSIRRG